ncbi:hypothetical protein VB780_29945 [Leptolyngbya sp. CCNP1308]|uniref:hypothetical protein n=1 Tax=Leptolyngbya sp. CCNP1308 TaxID=3110255 RepID=UPI002B20E14C|nr:hypothetical protein [Leptolyngbya sp. CCNP1308]MEA5452832.1 hypothetical protein [Leptolyngbya sp. CCNP1308]
MHPQKIKNLAHQIILISSQLNNAPSLSSSIQNSQNQDYKKLVLEVEKAWSEKFSGQYIRQIIGDLLRIALAGDSEKLEEEIAKQNSHFEKYETLQEVYIPLHGIEIYSSDVLELGRVKLFQVTQERFDELSSSMKNIIKTMAYSDTEKRHIAEENRNELEEKLGAGTICAKFCVVAEPRKAKELAIIEVTNVLKILRYSITAFDYSGSMRIELGLADQKSSSGRSAFAISEQGFWDNRERLTQSFRIHLNDTEKQKFHEIGLFDLSTIMSKTENKKTEFEKTLLRFLHWISDSHEQFEKENQLLSLFIGLESLFGSGKNAVGFGVAMILGKGLQQRLDLKNEISRLYTKFRNPTVHGSESRVDEVSESNIIYLREITMKLMIHMLYLAKEKKISSRSELQKLVEEMQLS